jgi:hypothetical protein
MINFYTQIARCSHRGRQARIIPGQQMPKPLVADNALHRLPNLIL